MTVADLIAALAAYPPDLEVRVDVATGHVDASEPGEPSLAPAKVGRYADGGEYWINPHSPAPAARAVLMIS